MDRFRRVWNETHRPPPLRTTSTYDDDEAFQSTAKQILARVQASSSPRDAIYNVLVSRNQRACFWEGLNQRKDHHYSLPSAMANLVQALDEALVGTILKDICSKEKSFNPRTPRCDCNNIHHHHHPNESQQPQPPHQSQQRKYPARRFFPASTRRVQNIDWKLCEAVQAVDNLRLDGQHHHHFDLSPMTMDHPTTTTNRITTSRTCTSYEPTQHL